MNPLYKDAKRSRMITGSIAILLLLVAVSLLGTAPVLHFFGLDKINATLLFASRLLYWLCAVLLWLYANKAEGQNALLWKDQRYPFSTYASSIVLLCLILFAGSVAINLLLSLTHLTKSSPQLSDLIEIFRANKALLLFTSLTAGVVEEFIFRGYLQPRFEVLFTNPYIAMLLSSLLFGLLHYRYGTVANVVVPFFIGFVFAFYYWKYRNLKVLMICHFLWDVIASFLLLSVKH